MITESTALRDVNAAVQAAAHSGWGRSVRHDRALWLEAIADAVDTHTEALVALAHSETHLAHGRLGWEVHRASSQLRFFADVVREGSYLEVTIDTAQRRVVPPVSGLRRMLRPVGTVAIFGASNFPFAFSVLGNDTASALAAGTPVVVKAHPGHPELSRRLADLARRAIAEAGGPADAITLVEGVAAGVELVKHPLIKAVAFTGSAGGGRALFDIASSRPDPIPFYGELGSINPVVITPSAARERAEGLAQSLAEVISRDGGQACTKPGLIFVPKSSGFEAELRTLLADADGQVLLTEGIANSFDHGFDRVAERGDVEVLVAGERVATEPAASRPRVIATELAHFAASPEIFLHEHFGPLVVLVRYSEDEFGDRLDDALAQLGGSLTGTLWSTASDAPEYVDRIVDALVRTSGRVVFDSWPLAVPVSWAQHHGGPWPASTASVHSSVGATAVRRFLIPVAYQDAPERILPPELRRDNPTGVPRRVDGVIER